MLSAPRAFWMLKTFGAPNVFILNGTFSKWEAEKRPVDTGDNERAWKRRRSSVPNSKDFDFHLDARKVRSFDDIQKIIHHQKQHHIHILDSRFRANYDQGHIETAESLPFPEVLNPDKTFKSTEELLKVFQQNAKVANPAKDEVVLSC
jgi:thiosulfate/3-mercaptopyruvate sulfurtransferase